MGGTSARQKSMQIFQNKQFTLTLNPILIVLLKAILAKFKVLKWGGQVPPEKGGGPRHMQLPSSATPVYHTRVTKPIIVNRCVVLYPTMMV